MRLILKGSRCPGARGHFRLDIQSKRKLSLAGFSTEGPRRCQVGVAHLDVWDVLGIQLVQVSSRYEISDHGFGSPARLTAPDVRHRDPAANVPC